ncbi:MAG: 4-demethylwyosine synthase TYW1 [Thermoprotei archaeon]|nr:MAG: 4-demethylwyosine synthase TYW1 [Thermoprotei archaeon]RLF24366.1 MAG: 4-demethylwyosine synthase TYW1 [Thermoprotei archaeon]
MYIPERLLEVYRKQGYHLAGRTGLVKPCHWLKKSLKTKGREFCYKQKFYGIPSHRCLQISLYPGCSQRCLYCWRVQPQDIGLSWNELQVTRDMLDDPEVLLRAMIAEHRRILSGYKGHPEVDLKMWEEAMNPVHLTPSLVGEPTLLGAEYLSSLFETAFSMGFKTVFLVTNGNFPEVLERLDTEPSQLYISLSAPDEETYKKVCRPLLPDGWQRILRSLELLDSFRCPTVVRITLVRGLNMKDFRAYAKILKKANPTYIEPKAAMALGYFRKRLPIDSMPRHEEIKRFALGLAKELGYNVLDESLHSRVVLLSRLEKPIRFY